MKPTYTEEDFKKEFFSLIEKQKTEFYLYDSVCPYCNNKTTSANTCPGCGAPQQGYNPSAMAIHKMKVRAHIMANIKKGS